MFIDFLHDSAEKLSAAPDKDTLIKNAFGLARSLGFDYFAYALRIDIQLVRPHFLVYSGFPQEWVDRYLGENYFERDPVMAQVMHSPLPLVWGESFFPSEGGRQIWEEAASHGLSHGVSFAVREGRGFAGVFTLARDRAVQLPRQEMASLIGQAQMLAGVMHQGVTRLELARAVPEMAVELTDRERECLRWAADGKTAWEIGQILCISERTAVFHLNNCTAKLGAVNKTQAIARAVALSLFASHRRVVHQQPATPARAPHRRLNTASVSAEVHAL